jgi:hypothetical protein
MLALLIVVVRALTLALRRRRELVLENLAAAATAGGLPPDGEASPPPDRDRLFWIILARSWRNWRRVLIVVQPDTVVVGIATASPPVMRRSQHRPDGGHRFISRSARSW